jgi:signal transduction histidine kinase
MLGNTAEDLLKMLDRYMDHLNAEEHQSMLEVLNLKSIFNEVKASIHDLVERVSVRIRLELDASPDVCFNRAYLEGVFINLLTNSLKYAHPDRSS